jgi:hypothetical protein
MMALPSIPARLSVIFCGVYGQVALPVGYRV